MWAAYLARAVYCIYADAKSRKRYVDPIVLARDMALVNPLMARTVAMNGSKNMMTDDLYRTHRRQQKVT